MNVFEAVLNLVVEADHPDDAFGRVRESADELTEGGGRLEMAVASSTLLYGK